MARSGGSRGGRARKPGTGSGRTPAPRRTRPARDASPAIAEEPRTFRLGAVPGATPGTWISRWRERYPHVELVLTSIAAATQRDALADEVDAAIVRLPVDNASLHAIPLYDEVTVAVVAADSHLTAADELDMADLRGEVVIVPLDDVLAAEVPGTTAPAFDPPADTGDAIATVAAGIGLVLVPLSVARMHARKDVAHRPVRDAPISRVGLAWPRDATTPDVEAFVGIVRGRTANSSR
jgi:hypothetical protein